MIVDSPRMFFDLSPALLRSVHDRLERIRVVERKVCKRLAVQVNIVGTKLMHQPRVGSAIDAGTCIDTGNPQLAISTFLQLTAYECVAHSFVHCVFSNGKDVFPSAEVAFGCLQDFFAPCTGRH